MIGTPEGPAEHARGSWAGVSISGMAVERGTRILPAAPSTGAARQVSGKLQL
jgi:hypothetical protein